MSDPTKCPACPSGTLTYTSKVLGDNPPQYLHRCDQCGRSYLDRVILTPPELLVDELVPAPDYSPSLERIAVALERIAGSLEDIHREQRQGGRRR